MALFSPHSVGWSSPRSTDSSLTVPSPCESEQFPWNRGLKQSAIHQPPIVPVSTLAWNPGGPQGDPRGIPWMTPLRDARRLDGLGQMTSRKALHVRGNELSWSGLDWDLYMYYIVLLCTQSIPSENTMSSVRKLPQHEESLASVWDLDMLACCRPQHGPPNYDPCREIWPFMNGLFTIRLLL